MEGKAEQIRAAVVRYVSRHPGVLTRAELTPIRSGETFRGEDDTLRIGSWALEERDGGPALVRRRGDGESGLTIVRLEAVDGDWRVTDVDEGRPPSE